MLKLRGLSHVSAVALLFAAGPLRAHDFWIEPSSYAPEVVSTVRVHLRVGERFRGEAVRRDPAAIESFVARTADGAQADVVAPAGMDPAGFYRIAAPGTVLLGYRSRRTPIRLDADRFNEYLSYEGLDPVLAMRRERGEEDLPGREVFSRCAKSILAAGGKGGDGFDQRFGWPLELVPVVDPTTLSPGDSLPVLVLRNGEPVAGVQVAARSDVRNGRRVTARSDARGRVLFTLDDAGPWLLSAVHMVPAPDGLDADWESFWASLTFELH